MRKFITFLILTVIFSTQLTTEVYSAGGLQHFFKAIVRFFKGSADDAMKSGDDLLKNMGKTREEILSGSKNSVEAKISETIGKEQHSLNFTTLKNTTRTRYIEKLKKGLKPDDAADVAAAGRIHSRVSGSEKVLSVLCSCWIYSTSLVRLRVYHKMSLPRVIQDP